MRKIMDYFSFELFTIVLLLGAFHLLDILFSLYCGKGLGMLLH